MISRRSRRRDEQAEAARSTPGRRSLRTALIPADYDTPAIPAPTIDVVSSKTAPIPVDEILAEIAEPPARRQRGRRAKPSEDTPSLLPADDGAPTPARTAEAVEVSMSSPRVSGRAPSTRGEDIETSTDASPSNTAEAPVTAAPVTEDAAAPVTEDAAAPVTEDAAAPLAPSPLPAHVPADAAETPLDETDPAADQPTEVLLREIELQTLTIEPVDEALDPLTLEVEPTDPVTPDALRLPAPSRPRRAEKRVRRVRTAWRPASRADRSKGAPTPSAPRPSSSAVRRPAWFKGLFSGVAMLFVLGMTAVMAIPTTVSASPIDAGIVQSALTVNTPGQELVTANTASTGTVDRDGYAVSDAGELQAAGYSSAQMLVGRQLAQEIMAAYASGKLVGSVPDHIKEIQYIADGVTVPDCGVDYRILEIIVIALHNFDQVGVSDINRKCTGQIEGAGTASSHYIDGGGHAVDFYLLNNASLNGADANTLKMISILDPIMPKGAHVGQAECRASAGIKLSFTNWTEFDDSCTHMHIDVPVTDAPLLLTDSSILPR
ncbi:hypothetical protein NY547_01705 [Cnuibacter physcomitrellae]|uniref:hypothetical protein n=1 Tax=Cnuibacter physcomitrellae TaxID=1619308 RepID=UPI002175D5DA|nr:hypothetical protein [Cnuibacter physcomitrellae]MCS5495957.1 hypothetical protein [Cnuibacter physcomitrellae]